MERATAGAGSAAVPATVDDYIAGFPAPVQDILRTVRQTLLEAVPEVQEGIGYRMPAYKIHGPLLYFAAFKDHWSLFGAGSVERLRDAFPELAGRTGGKGTIHFPLDEPVPVELVRAIALHRRRENEERRKR